MSLSAHRRTERPHLNRCRSRRRTSCRSSDWRAVRRASGRSRSRARPSKQIIQCRCRFDPGDFEKVAIAVGHIRRRMPDVVADSSNGPAACIVRGLGRGRTGTDRVLTLSLTPQRHRGQRGGGLAQPSSAEGGNRTHTARRPPDFESGASANSATSACRGMVRGPSGVPYSPTRSGKYGGERRKPMRASGPRWPRAIWSAAPIPPIGTKPSCRTAPASRAPAT
jgi:hypothetical protein